MHFPPLSPDRAPRRPPVALGRWPAALGLLLLALGACSPVYNWREVRPAGTPLLALMPCKPDQAERPVPLGGAPVTLHMHSCESGGLTFALGWAELEGTQAPGEALAQWRRAALAAIRVEPGRVDDPALQWTPAVPGAQFALGAVAQGVQHDQRPVQMKAAYFSRGQQVYQLAVYGAALPDEVTTSFFEGARLP
jgi:hypothetical protein